MSTSAFGVGGGSEVPIFLTDRQVRQVLAADPDVQGSLLSGLGRQINESRRRESPPHPAIPERLLKDWLRSLLQSKAAPQRWVERLGELTGTYDALLQRTSDLVVRRVGIDDPLIRANAALVVGDLRAVGDRLDEVLTQMQKTARVSAPEDRAPAHRNVVSLMAALGLLTSLQGDAEAATRLLLKASEMLEKGDPERPALLLLAGTAGAVAGARRSKVDIANMVLAQVDNDPMTPTAEASWRHARWVAHIWMGVDALSRTDVPATLTAFRLSNAIAPPAGSADGSTWAAVWLGQYALAAMGEGDPTIDVSAHQREALRLSRERTVQRPDWSPGWLARAQSDLLLVADAINEKNLEAAGPFLQDALTSLDRLSAAGNDSTDALAVRLNALLFSQALYWSRGDVAQAYRLLAQASAVADELMRRNVDTMESLHLAAMYAVRVTESEMQRELGEFDASIKTLQEALSLVERSAAGDGDAAWWVTERWRTHTLLADAAERSDRLELAQQHRREAVRRAEREAGSGGSPTEWQVRFWESLYALSKTLGKQYLAEEALRVHEQSLSLARRHATGERSYGEWHHRVFLSLMASTDFLRQRGGAVMRQYEEAARGPAGLYSASDRSGAAAKDLWTVRTAVGNAHLKDNNTAAAEQALTEALTLAVRALEVMPSSDNWLDRRASSHTRLAEVARANGASLLEGSHRQAAVKFSAQRSATALNSSVDQKDHWYRLYDLAMAQARLNLDRDALSSIMLARDLARRFVARDPKDPIWQQYLWYASYKLGYFAQQVRDTATAEGAYLEAAGVAEGMLVPGKDLKDWLERAAESLEALAGEYKSQSNEIEARRSSVRAGVHRSKVEALDREAEVREKVIRQVDQLLDVLSLTAEEARGLNKEALLVRLQSAIDQTTELIRKSGMSEMHSERLRGLRNALFVVRDLPDS